jgi:hypothetical protein
MYVFYGSFLGIFDLTALLIYMIENHLVKKCLFVEIIGSNTYNYFLFFLTSIIFINNCVKSVQLFFPDIFIGSLAMS